MIKGTIALAAILAAGAWFGGAFGAKSPPPAVADAGGATTDGVDGEGDSSRHYSDEECEALKDRLAEENLRDPTLQTKARSFGQALRQTAVTVTRLKQMETALRRHDCINDGDGKFREPTAGMKPADSAMAPPTPEPSYGSGNQSFGSSRN